MRGVAEAAAGSAAGDTHTPRADRSPGAGWLARRIGKQNAGRLLLLVAGLGLVASLVLVHVWLFF